MTKPVLGPRVLIVLNASTAWSRGVLRGFTDVAHQQGWTLLHYHPTADLGWLVEVWKPAVVALQASLFPEAADALRSCTVVSVNDDSSGEGIASVCLDEVQIAKLAANHLLAKGLGDLTTFRFNDGQFAVARERGFQAAVGAHGARIVPGWWIATAPTHLGRWRTPRPSCRGCSDCLGPAACLRVPTVGRVWSRGTPRWPASEFPKIWPSSAWTTTRSIVSSPRPH